MGSSVFLTHKIRENKDLFVILDYKVVPQVPKYLRFYQECDLEPHTNRN